MIIFQSCFNGGNRNGYIGVPHQNQQILTHLMVFFFLHLLKVANEKVNG